MTDLAVSSTVRELVREFQDAERVVRDSFRALRDAETSLSRAFSLGEHRMIRILAGRHAHNSNFESPDEVIEQMARSAWWVIVERLELRRMLSVKRFEELERQLDKEKLPPITEENVTTFARQFAENLPEMLTEAVSEVFEWLRPRNSAYKTNSELEVPRKVIIPGVVEPKFMGGLRVRHWRTQQLIALENVFHALDGKGQISKTYQSVLQTAIEAGDRATDLFRFKACLNGNLHLEFLRPDLLKRFNALAGGNRLRP